MAASLDRKPVSSLREFARTLGWTRLRVYQHTLSPDELTPTTRTVTWYESGNAEGRPTDLFLQINECPIQQERTYTVAVYAMRFRICTGWHSMRLTNDLQCDQLEVARMDNWIHRRWFETLPNRREFRRMHPECARYTWKRIREEGTPYEVVDAQNCVTGRLNGSRGSSEG